MNTEAKVGGQRRKVDPRYLCNWVGRLNLKATRDGDQFRLAAIYRALIGQASPEFIEAWAAEAKLCVADHVERENGAGVTVRIE